MTIIIGASIVETDMEKPVYANSFRELIAYQKSRQLAMAIFQTTKRFPKEEIYSLTDQIRRSSRSIGAQIAEAWAKRKYEKSFISKLTDADGEQQETQHWIDIALDCDYIDNTQADTLRKACFEIGLMLGSMIVKASHFCMDHPQAIREIRSEYFVNPDEDTTS
jgi:four helix bundle protein